MHPNPSTLWDLVGNTPLIYLRTLSERTGCKIYGKAEFLNPGGSVKDRAAKNIILEAEAAGTLKPGGTLVEGTAGNTGIGIATLAKSRGRDYKVIVFMPDNQAVEKYQLLEALGVELHKVPAVPFANPNHFYHQAGRMAESTKGAVWANQFENLANFRVHQATTGPEIWEQTQGQVSTFVCAVGSGGTIAGVSRYLKEKNKSIRVVAADPMGSGIFTQIKEGVLRATGSSVTEGIGIMRLTNNFREAQIDDAIQIDDSMMIDMLYHLALQEGLVVGTSAALNVYAAFSLAQQDKNSGKTFVTLLCDHGSRYFSRVFNPSWLAEKKLQPQPLW